jgi:ABC-type bacteriocin/lantibiotic exporter with double-glycine peptidase domain
MPDYVTVLRAFASENRGLYSLFLLTILTHPLEKIVFPHVFSTTLAAITNGGKQTPHKRILILVSMWVVIQVVYTLMSLLDTRMIPKFLDFARSRLIVDIMDSYETKFSDVMAGDLLSKIIKLPEALRDMFYILHHSVFVDILMHCFTIGYFYWVHPWLGYVYTGGIACWVLINYGFYNTCTSGSAMKEAAQDSLHEEIEDVLQNLLSVYVSDKKDSELKEVAMAQSKYSVQMRKSMMCSVKFRAAYAVLVIAMFISLVTMSLHLVKNDKIKPSSFIATFMVSFTAMGRLMAGFSSIRNLQHEVGVLTAVETFLAKVRAPKVREVLATVADQAQQAVPGEIRFEGVKFRKGDREILHGVDLTIHAGVTTALVGRVGCGKSTLVNLLMRLDLPDAGRILYGGKDIEEYSLSEWRDIFTYVPQSPKLRNRSLIENITYDGATATVEEVDTLLREAGLIHVADSFRPRYHETVGVGGKNLSGGQRQIVWLLRSLMSSAKLVVMDEPTSALDPESRTDIIKLLKSSFKGRTLVVVTHDPVVKQMAKDVIEMSDGNVATTPSLRPSSHGSFNGV